MFKFYWGFFLFGVFSWNSLFSIDSKECLRNFELHFFDENIVSQGLSLYQVRQELWGSIIVSLHDKSAEIPKRMKQKTAFMVPNPHEYPMDREKTAEILTQILYEVFIEAMKENYASNPIANRDIFNYLLNQHKGLFVRCFGEESKKLIPQLDW